MSDDTKAADDFRKRATEVIVFAEKALRVLNNGSPFSKLALDVVQKFACAISDEAANDIASLHPLKLAELMIEGSKMTVPASLPHWAMHMIARSLGESLVGVPNYLHAGMQIGRDGEMFYVTVHRAPGGKSPHQLREEMETERDEWKSRALTAEHRLASEAKR